MTPYQQLSVLVVDDDINIRSYMGAMLKTCGVGAVHLAETYLEAESIAARNKLDGAYLDLVLQRGSGLDVGRMLVAQGIPVVFCSGVADEFNASQMHEIGWLLPKPVRLAGIKRALESFVCHQRRCGDATCGERIT